MDDTERVEEIREELHTMSLFLKDEKGDENKEHIYKAALRRIVKIVGKHYKGFGKL